MTDTAERTIATPTERASVHEVLKEKVAAARLGGSESSRAKISESGKLLVRERLSLLFDDEDYVEDGLLARFEDGLPGDAVVIAFGRVDGRRVCVIANDIPVNDRRATMPAMTSSATRTPNPCQSRPRMVFSRTRASGLTGSPRLEGACSARES